MMSSTNGLQIALVLLCIYVQIEYGQTQGNNSTNITTTTIKIPTTRNTTASMNITTRTVNVTTSRNTTASRSMSMNITTSTVNIPRSRNTSASMNITTSTVNVPTSGNSSVPTPEPSPQPEPTNVSSESVPAATSQMTSQPKPSTTVLVSSSTSAPSSSSISASSSMLVSTSTSVPEPTTTPRTTTHQMTSTTLPPTSSESMSNQVPLTAQSQFGTHGLAAFAVVFAIAICELIIILVLLYLKRRNKKHEYNTAKAEKRTMAGDVLMNSPMDGAFGAIHTVDLDSDQDISSGEGKFGTGNGGVTTFGVEKEKADSTSRQPSEDGKAPSDTEQPSWVKVELSSPGADDEANEVIEPVSPISQEPSSPSQEPTSPLSQGPPEEDSSKDDLAAKGGDLMSEHDSDPLLPAPPPELDINQSCSSSLTENSSLSSNN